MDHIFHKHYNFTFDTDSQNIIAISTNSSGVMLHHRTQDSGYLEIESVPKSERISERSLAQPSAAVGAK